VKDVLQFKEGSRLQIQQFIGSMHDYCIIYWLSEERCMRKYYLILVTLISQSAMSDPLFLSGKDSEHQKLRELKTAIAAFSDVLTQAAQQSPEVRKIVGAKVSADELVSLDAEGTPLSGSLRYSHSVLSYESRPCYPYSSAKQQSHAGMRFDYCDDSLAVRP